MTWPQQPQYPPPPLPPDARIKKGVRRGEVFPDPSDAQRAVLYAEGFLKNGADLVRAPILLAIIGGLFVTVLLQLAVGNWFVLFVPGGAILGLLVYIVWFSLNKSNVELSLQGNRQVIGR